MLVSFVKGRPALLIRKERALVVGDLHIGMHLKLREKGFYFQRATERMAESLLETYKEAKARRLVLLGDVKESIGSPKFAEYRELKTFFESIAGADTCVVRGNHDGGIGRVLSNMGFKIPVESEMIIGGVALTHGNSWPSSAAMMERYVVVGHGHYALRNNDSLEKIWIVSKVTAKASKKYARYNRAVKLVAAPSFNSLITGSALSPKTKLYLPMFKNDVFEFGKADVYGMDGSLIGRVKDLMSADM
ncbi:MAG: metallophosphoesterase family protein [Candidatus Marsarchaeota archaeon]|nr:metallophosphoesterase family protein [Candidatus Marsarchaeota archaeon]